MAEEFKACLVADCNANAHHTAEGRRGYCMCHYRRFMKYGDPETRKRAIDGDPQKWLYDHAGYEGEGCLKWPFATRKDGYGHVRFAGTQMYVARAMCLIIHGPPPQEGMHGAHSCGKGHEGCIHPKHVYWATPVENIGDRMRHGTSNRGRAKNQVLTEQMVRMAKQMRARGSRICDIARHFDVRYKTLSLIFYGKSWTWVQ